MEYVCLGGPACDKLDFAYRHRITNPRASWDSYIGAVMRLKSDLKGANAFVDISRLPAKGDERLVDLIHSLLDSGVAGIVFNGEGDFLRGLCKGGVCSINDKNNKHHRAPTVPSFTSVAVLLVALWGCTLIHWLG